MNCELFPASAEAVLAYEAAGRTELRAYLRAARTRASYNGQMIDAVAVFGARRKATEASRAVMQAQDALKRVMMAEGRK